MGEAMDEVKYMTSKRMRNPWVGASRACVTEDCGDLLVDGYAPPLKRGEGCTTGRCLRVL